MGYRKFTADHLFTGKEILQGDQVLITDTKGIVIDIVEKKDAGDDIEILKGLLSPGFINAHCHLELSHLKGIIPAGTGLVEFVQQVMKQRIAPGEAKLEAMQNAEQEIFKSGTVVVGDICNTPDSIPVKQKSKLNWYNFIELSGFADTVAESRLETGKIILKQFGTNNTQVGKSLTPHSPYSVSKKLFQLLNDETDSQLITIHNQECSAENEFYKNKTGGLLALYQNLGIDISDFKPTGETSLKSWLPWFTKDQPVIFVHNTFMNQGDVNFIKTAPGYSSRDSFFCLCINANKYIEQAIPPIELLRKNNCDMVIGTDSYASNWQLRILEEIKTIQRETNCSIPLSEILQWATINGSRALQVADRYGSFEKGKQPGVVLIDEMHMLNITGKSSAKRIL